MGYVVCEKCGGYYHLQKGESPTDFEECRCGGRLEYVDSLEELDRGNNSAYIGEENKLKEFISSNLFLRIIGVLIGTCIMYIPYYIFSPYPNSPAFVLNHLYTSLAVWFTGGLVAAFIADGNLKDGIANGFYPAFLSGLVVITLFYWFFNNQFTSPSTADNLAFFAALSTVYILFPGIFSAAGGLIGVLVRKAF
jgi:hypothetical protein